jgi:hypothetical protein
MFEKRKAILREALKCKDLKKLDKRNFLKAWKALAFLHPGLHPDDTSNWPKRLKPFAREAFRRFEKGKIAEEELYPVSDALKGLEARRVQ